MLPNQARWIWRILLFAVFAAVRLAWLTMDPPNWLSWSAGLYTDEGFYTLDARHWVLFQHAALGNFHDSLLAPGLSAMQHAIFGFFGVSDLCARYLSVVMSLATLVLFWFALRRSFGEDTADIGTCFLGLLPAVVFYNRMALQETPATFFLVASLCARSYADKETTATKRTVLECICGALAAMLILFKPLGLLALPALVLLGRSREQKIHVLTALAGAVAVLGLWFVVLYAPNHAELARMGSYYRGHQTLPGSVKTLWLDVKRGLVSPRSGLVPFLLFTCPVALGLAAYAGINYKTVKSAMSAVLVGWLACGVLYCLVMVYSPSRYYILFMPALSGLAAAACSNVRPAIKYSFVGLFSAMSLAWILVSFSQREFGMADARSAVTHLVPANALVVGDMAPALCMDSHVQASPMQPGLSNDKQPVETLKPYAIALVRSTTWDNWWTSRYPGILNSDDRLGGWTVGPGYRIELFRVGRDIRQRDKP